ncbi:MAG: chemotaxis protein CheA [Planctomycetaceae bacterium]|nr:chemotaxis protein CheA [Planctomycetaceae bacterium]
MSLILEFVQEAREYIDEVEPTLIEIYHGSDELGAVDAELINSVFRLFHSMKGSAGFLALNTIASVTHEAETLLDKIRNGKLNLTVEITETLCKALDLFREMLEKIADSGEDSGFESQAAVIVERLKEHSEGKNIPEPQTPPCQATKETKTASTATVAVVSTENLQPENLLPETQNTENNEQEQFLQTEPPSNDSINISPEMRLGFVQEGNEQIDGTEQSLLHVLENKSTANESLKEAFRYIHSFKGNCGFLGFVDLEHLSHTMETFLDMLKIGVVPPEDQNISCLLSLLDVLREGINAIEVGRPGDISHCAAHVKTLNDLMMIHEDSEDRLTPEISSDRETPSGETENAATNGMSAATQSTASSISAAKSSSGPPETKPNIAATSATTSGGSQTPGAKTSGTAASKHDIRVDLHKLDALINLVGELVIAESMVTRCPAVAHVEDDYYNRAKHQLRRICDDLKDVAMSVRMIPLSATFRKMVRLVHDLGTKSGKKIKLNLVGEETEVDKTVIEQIADPLVHIVRNSCDHGIEEPEERIVGGKPETGVVTLEGRHEGGEVWILIKDDGRGLRRDKILAKAFEKGLVGPDAKDWPDERVYRLVFEAGFSTAEKITDISGRGVGMDVVRKNIEKLNGRIDIQSRDGEGSTFILRIPLTLAIIDAMLVRVGSAKYMIPTLMIRESLVPVAKQVTITPDGKEILRLREEMIPIIRLYDIFNQEPESEKLKDGILIVAEDAGHSFAIFVDEIVGQQQTVIKGLPDYLGKGEGFSGCTILGDGTVSLIIDVGTLSQMQGTFAAPPCNKDAYWNDDVPKGKEMKEKNEYTFEQMHADVKDIHNMTHAEIEKMNPEDIPWEMFEASVKTVEKQRL